MSEAPPIIDLKPWFRGSAPQREALARDIGEICHRVGFFYVLNHGIPQEVSASYLAAMKAFFALPLQVREAIDKHHSAQFRGWEKLGSEVHTRLKVDENFSTPVNYGAY